MTITNYVTNPSVEVDLTGMSLLSGSTAGTLAACAWRDTTDRHQTSGSSGNASLRVNNTSTASNGVVWGSYSLTAGTYGAAIWARILASTTNAAFVVRRQSDGLVLVQKNWDSPLSTWNRSTSTPGVATTAGYGFFSLSATTTVEVVVGVGIYGSASAGSARFDEVIITQVGTAGMDTSSTLVPDYFDGSSPDTASTTYAWTGTANNSTSTATPVVGGTYQSWTLVYADDFSSGSVPNATHWYVQDGYKGTCGNGNRVGSLSKVSGGQLHLTTNGDNISGVNSKHPITYGRIIVWQKKDPRPGYSPVIMLWPANNKWAEGELDLYEGQGNSSFDSNFHQCNTGSPQTTLPTTKTSTDTTVVHKYEIQWLPDSVTYLLDDEPFKVVTDTRYIPTTPFVLILQEEVKLPKGTCAAAGTVRPSYPAAYSPPWEATVERVEIYSASTSANHQVRGQGVETIPNPGPGAPGIPVDTATASVHHYANAVEASGSDLDTAEGTVPGQGSGVVTPPSSVTSSPCPRWIWESPGGDQIELTNWVDDTEVLRGLTGWMSPPLVVKRDTIPQMAGAVTRQITHGVRQVRLPVVATRADLPALEDTLANLVRAMDATKGQGTLTRISTDGRASSLQCEVTAGLSGDARGVYGVLNEPMTVTFEAPDPYWESEVLTKGFTGSQAGSWFPMLGGFHLAPSSIFSSFTIDSTSDVDTWPVWTILGPGTDPVLTNLDTGESIALTATLGAKDAVTIDTRPGQKLVIGPDGSNWFPNLVSYQFWPLRPGENNVSLEMGGSTSASYLSISYWNRTLMP